MRTAWCAVLAFTTACASVTELPDQPNDLSMPRYIISEGLGRLDTAERVLDSEAERRPQVSGLGGGYSAMRAASAVNDARARVIDAFVLVDLWAHAHCLEDRAQVERRLKENLLRFSFDALKARMALDDALKESGGDEPVVAQLKSAQDALHEIAQAIGGLKQVFPDHAKLISGEPVPMTQ